MADVIAQIIDQQVVVQLAGGGGPSETQELRMLRVPVGEQVNQLPAAGSRIGFLGFDSSGQPIIDSLVVTGATGQTVATRVALAAIGTPANGQAAYLAEAGRQGMFIFSTANLSSQVTNDPGQGIYVPPSSDTTGASGAWVRAHEKGYYKGSWFGVVADGVTNDTVAIQRGWDYVATYGGGRIEYPAGKSVIGGALTDVALSNAQLVLPKVENVDSTIALELVGSIGARTGDPDTSTIWRSSLASAGNIIGCKTATGRTIITLVMRGITLRLAENTSMTALDLGHVTNCDIAIRVDVDDMLDGAGGGLFSLAQPTNVTNYGIKTPDNGVAAKCHLDSVVAGYYYGYRIGELVSGNIVASACLWPIITTTGDHPAHLTFALVTNSPNTLKSDGQLELNIDMLDIEHDTAAGSGPAWVEPFGVDIDDAGNALHGRIWYHMHDYSIPFAVTGAANAQLKQVEHRQASFDYFPIFGTYATLTNASSLVDIMGKFGGVPWLTQRLNQTSGTGLLGVHSYANTGLAGPEYRLVQVAAACDGETDRGTWGVTVWRDGTEKTNALQIKSDGSPMFPFLVSAADDAAAAAAGVPIKGLYHNAGAVRQRLT